MKLAFSTLGCAEWSLETIVHKAIVFGIDCVELRGGAKGHVSPEFTAERRREVRRIFDNAGVGICCVTAYSRLSSPEESERAEQIDDMKRYVELAADLGSPNVRTFFGPLPWYVYRGRVYDYAAEMLNTVAAGLDSVRVLVETHDSMSAGEDLDTGGPLLARVDSSMIGVVWEGHGAHQS
jgi:sugar phosphate isomerase/epimerase